MYPFGGACYFRWPRSSCRRQCLPIAIVIIILVVVGICVAIPLFFANNNYSTKSNLYCFEIDRFHSSTHENRHWFSWFEHKHFSNTNNDQFNYSLHHTSGIDDYSNTHNERNHKPLYVLSCIKKNEKMSLRTRISCSI